MHVYEVQIVGAICRVHKGQLLLAVRSVELSNIRAKDVFRLASHAK